MDFENLRLFLAVSEQEVSTRAAIKLCMTQTTISKRVQQLEDEVGTRLLYRHGRGVELTEAGARLQQVARSVFVQLDAVKEELDDGTHQLNSLVTLGLPPSLGASLIAPLARTFQERFPKAKLRVIEAFSGSLLELIDAGKVNIGVLYDARLSPTMLVQPLLREDLYLIESALMPGSGEPAAIDELGRGPFVLSNPSNGMRRVVDAAAAASNIRVDVTMEVDSLTALKRLAEIGPARCVLPYGAVYREVSEGKLRARPFEGRGLHALLVSATPLHKPVPRLTKELYALLVEQIEGCLAAGVLTGKSLA